MIDLYTWTTPNGHKIPIMLEETRLEYTTHPVDLGKGEQKTPEFLAINPNGKIPAIVDHEGPGGKPVTVFESGAILIYLAEKTGKFLPREGEPRAQVLEWLMFQMSAVGPILGQLYYFAMQMPEKLPQAIEHFRTETARIVGVLEGQLGRSEFLAGDYSIADIAIYPWLISHKWQGMELEDFANVKRWFDAIAARPAVQRGIAVLADQLKRGPIDEKTREVLFGKQQYEKR
jgi:GST-like protein